MKHQDLRRLGSPAGALKGKNEWLSLCWPHSLSLLKYYLDVIGCVVILLKHIIQEYASEEPV